MSTSCSGTTSVDARSSIFTHVGRDQHITHINQSQDDNDILANLKPVVGGGFYVLPCMVGTRSDILKQIDSWLGDRDSPNVLWLSGSPGAGKSTIASSMVQGLRRQGKLGSCFFFNRHDAVFGEPAALWRTVAYDLGQFDPNVKVSLTKALKERRVDPTRPEIELHFELMIEGPLVKNCALLDENRVPIIVVDALDECCSDTSNVSQRNALLRTISRWSHLPRVFKLMVTSRDRVPEPLREFCKHIVLRTGDLVNPEANNDIRHFFTERFTKAIGPEWSKGPGRSCIDQLTKRAAGLFIWAETVMNFVEQGIPDERLELILKGNFGGGLNLNNLYRRVLELAFDGSDSRTLEAVRTILAAIVLAKSPLHRDDLHYFVRETNIAIQFVLNKLSSVVCVDRDGHLRVTHLSLTDFLCDSTQCPKDFFIDQSMQSEKLTLLCLRLMEEGLHFNICGLETSYVLNDDVKDLATRVQESIPSHLVYACRFWAVHLGDVTGDKSTGCALLDEIEMFFYSRFLFWVEVMSLVKEVSEASVALQNAARWIGTSKVELSKFATDARKFIVNFHTPISKSVPHIYLSALPFSSPDSMVSKCFLPQFPQTLSFTNGETPGRPALINILTGHMDTVFSVDFSPDGKQIVSGSGDMTIRVWEVETGEVVSGPFTGHTDAVCSVMFSHDGNQIVSGSGDKTIRIWDIGMAKPVAGPFEGHTDWVRSVRFSPDGKCIASGSDDKTVRVWNAETGDIVAGPFRAHKDWVCSIAFSPDGKRIVSGSGDEVIRVWDIDTGRIIARCADGSGWIYSVAFSPDGQRIVSGASDCTICILDAETCEGIAGPFKSHMKGVRSVVFSPDGKNVLSGSDDMTIMVCDADKGVIVAGPFDGHMDCIRSVGFSPDAKRIVSGSDDRTIRIWDVETSEDIFEGHTEIVCSAEFSPDGTRIVSGSRDNTILLWNAATGKRVAGPFRGHTDWVNSVCFSPDGKCVVSGSHDKTVRIWNAETGEVVSGPFEGHTDAVCSVGISPDGKLIVSGSGDKNIRVWDAKTGQNIARPFEGHTDWVRSVRFSPDGMRIVSGSDDRSVRVWDARTGEVLVGPLRDHRNWVCSVAFSPDGKHIVSGSGDTTIRIWDAQTGKMVAGPFDGQDWVFSVGFSPNGRYIMSGSGAETILVLNAKTGKIVAEPIDDWETGFSHFVKRLTSYHLSRDELEDEEELEAEHELDEIAGSFLSDDGDAIRSAGFSPKGDRIVYTLKDEVLVWHAGTGSVGSHLRILNSIGGPNVVRSCRDRDSYGWASSPNRPNKSCDLLFWVPHLLRESLCGIDAVQIMGTCKPQLDLSRFVHGTSWTQCCLSPHANNLHIPNSMPASGDNMNHISSKKRRRDSELDFNVQGFRKFMSHASEVVVNSGK